MKTMGGQTVKLGIAGCGSGVIMYGPALRFLEKAKIVAWADPIVEKAQGASRRYGGQAFADYDAFLGHPELDAVIIVTPPWLHLEQAQKAAAAGKHVLCEKPMARTVEECDAMIRTLGSAKKILMIGFMKRFSPYFRQVKELIEAGEVGEILEIKSDWSWPQYALEPWRDKRINLGGLFLDHGSHTIDLARWWAGEVTSVSAQVRIHLVGREVEDYAQAVYRHVSGCVSTHYNSRLTHRPLRESYTIEGSKATLVLECLGKWSYTAIDAFTLRKYTNGRVVDITPTPGVQVNPEDHFEQQYMYRASLGYFLDCVQANREPEYCTGVDGRAAIEAINAAYLAADENRVVNLPLKDPYDPEAIFNRLVDKSSILPTEKVWPPPDRAV
jgi:predicted dehydrogenase